VHQIPATAPSAGIIAPEKPSGLRRDWLWGLILILAVVLVYSPVRHAGFIWDDDGRVTANPCIVGPLGLKEVWTTSHADLCPLVYTTFWVEHALWGLDPLPYHLVNVLLHGACAILLWRVLRSLLVPGAWLGAALWALHPVQVETVAWVTEMKNTQSTFFYLLTILFYVKGLKAGAIGDRRGDNWNYGLTLLWAILAMASKSSTVVLPIVLGLCAWWVEGRWQWRNLARLWPFALMTIFPSALTLWTQRLLATPADQLFARSLPERLVTAGDAVWFYLGKLLWPHPLIFIYPRWQVDAGWWFSWLPLLAVITLLLILWLKRETWLRPFFFTFAYFVAALLPVLGLVDGFFWRYSLVGDHFQYLACMGPLALAGAGLTWLAQTVMPNKREMQAGLGAGLLLILGLMSWQRAWAYNSDEVLWTDTLAKNSECWMGYDNLGNAVIQKGQVDRAILQYQRALKINPNDAMAYNNLASALLQKGQVDEAIEQCQNALKINPNDAAAYNNLGHALFKKGQVDEAIEQYQHALKISPSFAQACYNLGNALFQQGQVEEAIEQFRNALKTKPNYAEACNNLGNALLQKGQVDEAIQQFQNAIKINAYVAEAYNNLGSALLRKGQVEESIAQFQEAVRLKPDQAGYQKNLSRAQAMARQGQDSK